ncbi:MAG: SDR family oxidoreductase [Nitrospinae bacterium]|nr:SDR family oxidoreductase [Nitrospinota bacterium]
MLCILARGWGGLHGGCPKASLREEVAGLIAFLCSFAAAYMTGQSINIDGGLVMW